MAILTTSGRAAMASAIKQRPLFLGWGAGLTWWDSANAQAKAFVNDVLVTDHGNLDSVKVQSSDGVTTYTVNTDYSVEPVSGTIRRLPGGSIAAGATVVVTYVPHRDAENPAATSLLNPLGYRRVTQTDFVYDDPQGTIQLTSGRYTVTNDPSPELYTRTSYDYEDGANSTIRELALFMDCVPNPGLPAGQMYFAPTDMASIGLVVAVQNIAPLRRDAAVKQSFEFVLVI